MTDAGHTETVLRSNSEVAGTYVPTIMNLQPAIPGIAYRARVDTCRTVHPSARIVDCGVCRMPGIVHGINRRGTLVMHPYREHPCRAVAVAPIEA